MQYILIGKNPVQIECFLSWGQWFEWMSKNRGRHVAFNDFPARPHLKKKARNKKGARRASNAILNRINKHRGQSVVISTVFLGLDHNPFGGKPILFETMIFGGKHDDYQERYCTWDEAAQRHQSIVQEIR
ncbi:MAG: hypothetical protein ABJG42_24540 [Vibrio splendidus]